MVHFPTFTKIFTNMTVNQEEEKNLWELYRDCNKTRLDFNTRKWETIKIFESIFTALIVATIGGVITAKRLGSIDNELIVFVLALLPLCAMVSLLIGIINLRRESRLLYTEEGMMYKILNLIKLKAFTGSTAHSGSRNPIHLMPLAGLLLLSGCAQEPLLTEGFQHPVGFEFDYPKGWKIEPMPVQASIVPNDMSVGKDGSPTALFIIGRVLHGDDFRSPSDPRILQSYEYGYASGYKSAGPTEEFTAGGVQMARDRFVDKDKSMTFISRLIPGGYVINIHAMGREKVFRRHEKTLLAILASVRPSE